MKKNYLLLVLLVCASIGVMGQTIFTYANGGKSPNFSYESFISSQDGEPGVIYINGFNKNMRLLNLKNNECTLSESIDMDKDYKHIGAFKLNERFYDYLYTVDKSTMECGIYLSKMNPQLSELEFEPKNIAKFRGKGLKVQISKSKNSEYIGILSFIDGESKGDKAIHVMVCEPDGAILWETSMNSKIDGDRMNISSMVVNDEGRVSLLIYSFSKERRERANEQFMLWVMDGESPVEHRIDMSRYNVETAEMIERENGDLLIAAYVTTSNNKKDVGGLYYANYDASEDELTSEDYKPFGEERLRKQKISKTIEPVISDIIERPDGGVTVLGEMRQIVLVTDKAGGTTYFYLAGDIFVHNISASNDYSMSAIQKQQTSVSGRPVAMRASGSSYRMWQDEAGNIHLIYNDNIKNVNGVYSKPFQNKKYKSAKIVHAVIDKDNEVSYQDILDNKVTCMYRFIQFNNGVAYFTTWDKSNKFNYHRIDFTNSEDVTTATTSQADYDDEDDEDDED